MMIDLNALQALLTATEALTDDERRAMYADAQRTGSLTPEHMEVLRKAKQEQAKGLIADFDETTVAAAELERQAQAERQALEPVAGALATETLNAMHTIAADHARTLREIEAGLDAELRERLGAEDAAAADAIRASLTEKPQP